MVDAEVRCRCEVLNNLTGAAATEYARVHLDRLRTDGMGRSVHRCPRTATEWTEEHRVEGYGEEITVLRRLAR